MSKTQNETVSYYYEEFTRDRMNIFEVMNKLYEAGRATPDREMLKRFADFLYTQEIIDITGDYSDSIDQFLTLESQRGEDERG